MIITDKPWMTGQIKYILNRWSGCFNKTRSEYHKIIRNHYRIQVRQQIATAKNDFFERQSAILGKPDLNAKIYWSIINRLTGRNHKPPFHLWKRL